MPQEHILPINEEERQKSKKKEKAKGQNITRLPCSLLINQIHKSSYRHTKAENSSFNNRKKGTKLMENGIQTKRKQQSRHAAE